MSRFILLVCCVFVALSAFQISALGVTTAYPQASPTDLEQLLLEKINRSRQQPAVEAARLGVGLFGGVSGSPKQPLAFNASILAAARAHTYWMLATDNFTHTGSGGSNAQARMTTYGYPFSDGFSWAENIAWKAYTGAGDSLALVENIHAILFQSQVHQPNMLNPAFDEAGLGLVFGLFKYQGENYNTLMATENFAYSGGSPSPEAPFVTGVVYLDTNGNSQYDPGEGVSGVTVTIDGGSWHAVSTSSGGYALPADIVTTGVADVTFSCPAFILVEENVVLTGQNVKVDLKIPTLDGKVILAPSHLAFGPVNIGSPREAGLLMRNLGDETITVTGLTLPAGFSSSWSGTIPPGQSRTAPVYFAPGAAISYTGRIIIQCDLDTIGEKGLDVSGTGVTAPVSPSKAKVKRQGKKKVKVTWGGGIHLSSYAVERREAGKKAWKVVGKTGTNTRKYVDKKLKSGKRYTYRVRAHNPYGGAINPSRAKSIKAR